LREIWFPGLGLTTSLSLDDALTGPTQADLAVVTVSALYAEDDASGLAGALEAGPTALAELQPNAASDSAVLSDPVAESQVTVPEVGFNRPLPWIVGFLAAAAGEIAGRAALPPSFSRLRDSDPGTPPVAGPPGLGLEGQP
jgi:hypothetical protein